MKVEKSPSYLKMLEEIIDTYGEYLEMGCSLDDYLLNKLHVEKQLTHDLKQRIEFLERKKLS